jgi:two-component system response regulator
MSTRVLLVEDSPDDEALTLRALRKVDPSLIISVARDGVEAISALGLDSKEFGCVRPDLVLLDIKIPKLGGLEVLRRIRCREETANLNVVMLTSSDEPSDVRTARALNASKYVRKPVDYDDFMSTMTSIFRELLPG